MGKRGLRRNAGLTLIEIAIAAVVLSIAIVGSLSLILSVHTHNQATSDSRLATKAAQEVMEWALVDSHSSRHASLLDWRDFWNHIGTGPVKDGGFFTPQIHKEDPDGKYELGRIQIRDISNTVTLPNHAATAPALPYLFEITVSVTGKDRDGNQVTAKPLNVSLVSRRSAK